MHLSSPAALGLWLGVAAVAQAAQESTVDFNIPAQPLASALDAFSKQSGVHLFYADGLLQGKRSAGLQGVYRPGEALGRLLAGTGIGYTFTGSNAAALKANTPAGAGASDTLPSARAKGKTIRQATA